MTSKPSWTSDDGKLQMGLGPTVEAGINDYDLSVWRYGAAADLSFVLDQGLVFSGSATALYQNFDSEQKRDGMRYSVQGQLVKAIDPSLSVALNAGILVEKAHVENLEHVDWTLGAAVSKEWTGGWITRVSPSVTNRNFDGMLALVPEAREDWAWSVGTQLSNRNFSAYGFMPVLNYTYTNQRSNDVFQKYDSHDVAITLTRNF